MRIILGSASPRRKEILAQAGIEFEVMASDCEEQITGSVPSEVVEELSRQKAEDVWKKVCTDRDGELLVIGADTIVALGNTIYGKPEDENDAVKMLRSLSGTTHQVYTGVTVITEENRLTFSACTDVTMYEVGDEEINAYVLSGEPMDKAGAYAIQGGYARYIKGINGEYNNVVGFPIARMVYEVKKAGIHL